MDGQGKRCTEKNDNKIDSHFLFSNGEKRLKRKMRWNIVIFSSIDEKESMIRKIFVDYGERPDEIPFICEKVALHLKELVNDTYDRKILRSKNLSVSFLSEEIPFTTLHDSLSRVIPPEYRANDPVSTLGISPRMISRKLKKTKDVKISDIILASIKTMKPLQIIFCRLKGQTPLLISSLGIIDFDSFVEFFSMDEMFLSGKGRFAIIDNVIPEDWVSPVKDSLIQSVRGFIPITEWDHDLINRIRKNFIKERKQKRVELRNDGIRSAPSVPIRNNKKEDIGNKVIGDIGSKESKEGKESKVEKVTRNHTLHRFLRTPRDSPRDSPRYSDRESPRTNSSIDDSPRDDEGIILTPKSQDMIKEIRDELHHKIPAIISSGPLSFRDASTLGETVEGSDVSEEVNSMRNSSWVKSNLPLTPRRTFSPILALVEADCVQLASYPSGCRPDSKSSPEEKEIHRLSPIPKHLCDNSIITRPDIIRSNSPNLGSPRSLRRRDYQGMGGSNHLSGTGDYLDIPKSPKSPRVRQLSSSSGSKLSLRELTGHASNTQSNSSIKYLSNSWGSQSDGMNGDTRVRSRTENSISRDVKSGGSDLPEEDKKGRNNKKPQIPHLKLKEMVQRTNSEKILTIRAVETESSFLSIPDSLSAHEFGPANVSSPLATARNEIINHVDIDQIDKLRKRNPWSQIIPPPISIQQSLTATKNKWRSLKI